MKAGLIDTLCARMAAWALRRPGVAGLVNMRAGGIAALLHPERDPFEGTGQTLASLLSAMREQSGAMALADVNRIWLFAQLAAMISAEKVPGAVAEFGVYKGKTAKLLRLLCADRELYLFDTFEGFDGRDLADGGPDAAGREALDGAFKDTSEAAVRAFVGEDHLTHYRAGWFPDSAKELDEDLRFALVHVDCDLEQPAEAALQWFWPRLSVGGAMIFHDHGSGHWPGIARALERYFADTPWRPVPVADLSGSAVVRKGRG
jgi:hypothetical protein